ncbi:phenylalanine--tRNA ligase subunit alpha [Lutispora saccharofermentans]|uniref:Phenylalanine--tRNA ligase alpha subunit n=1 Tax=Lutispora saccharofermentans TaxID=3024236 RepID=A0ABT1NIB2_9FIRM|nr:phenylalanine--tRNA ligase subunit alpha [Lutispora saccharofermentans]MCQ1531027.1 phenylalanine--tRNA ligase subunit alpha [Lutispora saccharofermentans]
MKDKLEKIKSESIVEIDNVENAQQLEEIRIKYLGKKGELTQLLRGMGQLSPEERPLIGQLANEVRDQINDKIEETAYCLKRKDLEKRLRSEFIDVTMPGKKKQLGNRHPMTKVLNEIEDIFIGMGFTVVEGPEIEKAYYNFDALNHSKYHPARDMQDTFYITEELLLRTQTSPNQVRTMEKQKPPIRVIVPGRVYRADEIDATHSPMFHQIEGLVVDKGITMANLKGTLDIFAKKLYGEKTQTKFRPHHFPFTEPSAEMDCTCSACGGTGCRICKYTGWIEILGAGMVHPNVLANCGIDTEVYSGFAFGMGLDRITMLKYDISDLRLMFENDKRFLDQF